MEIESGLAKMTAATDNNGEEYTATVKDLATVAKVTRTTVIDWCNKGIIKHRRYGQRIIRISKSELNGR